jgi:hypothetical protein
MKDIGVKPVFIFQRIQGTITRNRKRKLSYKLTRGKRVRRKLGRDSVLLNSYYVAKEAMKRSYPHCRVGELRGNTRVVRKDYGVETEVERGVRKGWRQSRDMTSTRARRERATIVACRCGLMHLRAECLNNNRRGSKKNHTTL